MHAYGCLKLFALCHAWLSKAVLHTRACVLGHMTSSGCLASFSTSVVVRVALHMQGTCLRRLRRMMMPSWCSVVMQP